MNWRQGTKEQSLPGALVFVPAQRWIARYLSYASPRRAKPYSARLAVRQMLRNVSRKCVRYPRQVLSLCERCTDGMKYKYTVYENI